MRKPHIFYLALIFILAIGAVKFFGLERKSQIERELAYASQSLKADLISKESASSSYNTSEAISKNEIPISTLTDSGAGLKCAEKISAKLALIRFLNNSDNIYALKEQNQWPIASITKLMTATIVLENMDLTKAIILDDQMTKDDGITGDLKSGESYLISDLLKAMLMISSNHSAEAIAQSFGRDKFIELMNKKAKDLGMNDTYFFDPTGLSVKNQSTPNDIFRLTSYIYNSHSEIFNISRQKKAELVNLKTNKKKKIFSINEFAGKADFIGGKTGHIEDSKGNLISMFSIGSRQVVIIILGSDDRFGDTRKLKLCI